MNRTQLVEKVVQSTGASKKEATAMVNATFDAITEAVAQGDTVQLIGFGTFGRRERGARTAKNPRTGETVEIAATNVPYFKPGKELKDAAKK